MAAGSLEFTGHLTALARPDLLAEALQNPDEPVRQVAEYLVKSYSLKLGV
jgi:hypothetical protein